jgi:hypothetical protein
MPVGVAPLIRRPMSPPPKNQICTMAPILRLRSTTPGRSRAQTPNQHLDLMRKRQHLELMRWRQRT